MSALATEFQNRYSAQRVLELTRPDDTDETTADTTKLEKAVTAATAEFATLVQKTLDTGDAQHLNVACRLIEMFLVEWGAGASSAAEKLRTRITEDAKRLSLVTGRDRIMPQTNSILTPSSEQRVAGETVRPDFDIRKFDDLIPGIRDTDEL